MNDKIKKLNTYLSSLQAKLSDPTPLKHLGRPIQYRQFLQNEIQSTKSKLDSLKLGEK
jgi:hypothetical protein